MTVCLFLKKYIYIFLCKLPYSDHYRIIEFKNSVEIQVIHLAIFHDQQINNMKH